MSIWPHAMLKRRPSSDVDLVRPVMACLVAVYGAECGRGDVGRDRSVVDDPAALRLLRFHQQEGLLRAEKRPRQVDVHHRLPLFDGQLLERRAARGDARVVEQHVQPPEPLARRGEKGSNRIRIADVGWDDERVCAMRSGLDDRLLQQRLAAAGQHHGVVRVEQTDRHGPANTGPCSRDNRHLGSRVHVATLTRTLHEDTRHRPSNASRGSRNNSACGSRHGQHQRNGGDDIGPVERF